MTVHRSTLRAFVVLGTLAAGAVLWHITLVAKDPSPAADKQPPPIVTTDTLGGADRYLTHVSTDKPVYRPGETLYVRGAILHHASHKPLAEAAQVTALVEIQGPKGDTVASGFVASQRSVLGYTWAIPEEQAGGEYTIKVTYPGFGHAPAVRKFDVRAYRAPRLKSQIEFLRDGYGPGDDVTATLEVHRAEGGAPVGAQVTVIARLDGADVFRGGTVVDEYGQCYTRFKLPEEIRRGEGTLAWVIEDGGVVETASKTIPILLQTVDLTAYPEGGELVAGLPNRVYYEAFTPAKKPADLAGAVLDAEGREVALFRSEHEGRGRFEFTPKTGASYSLKITEPSGIKKLFPLPEVKPEGVVLRSESDVFEPGAPILLHVGTRPFQGDVKVTLSKREAQVAEGWVNFKGSEFLPLASVVLKPDVLPDDVDGVLIATVWSADGKPLAERLIYRRPANSIRVNIVSHDDRYVPGGQAELTVETTDQHGEPIEAVVGLTVTDDSVLEMIEKREQAPRLPVMVLLENDVRELADAHVYLDPENPAAPKAVDLLLGTQGWRRFALIDTAKFIAAEGDLARRALALRMVSQRRLMEVFQRAGEGQGKGGWQFDGRLGAMPPMDDGLVVPEGAPAPPDVDAAPPADVPAAPPVEVPLAPAPPADPPPVAGPMPAPPVAAEPPAPVMRPPVMAAELPLPALKPLSEQQQRLEKAMRQSEAVAGKRALLADLARAPIRNDFVAVRIYAHQVRSGRQPGQRTDFTETLFWHAGVKTDAETGKATVAFGLNDSVTSFRVTADAFNADGTLGSGTAWIESVEPFYVEPKLPLEVTAGDRIRLPIGIVNATAGPLGDASIEVDAHPALQLGPPAAPVLLQADARLRRLLDVTVGQYNGEAELTLSAAAGPYADRVTRTLSIKPQGFPVEVGFGGMLSADGEAEHEIVVPEMLVRGSTASRAVVYPTPLANLTEALARLIREPYGCFEQTSSTTYPLVMAQQYFTTHTGVDPDLVRRSSETLDRGHDRLIGFECENRGYEWFAADPGHEALTAYGLLEFDDMAEVRQVDPEMIERTRQWLLAARDGNGGFSRERRTLHTWITDPDCSNAYIVWALLETGEKADLSREVAWIREAAEKTQNTYVLALAANVLALSGDVATADALLDRLAGKQTDDGSVEGATTSIVGSGGEALKIETTSLALLGWLKNPHYAANVEKAMNYLAEVCKAGRFGSTQSTVLALKAIVEYDKSRAKPKAPGSLQLIVDGRPMGEPVAFGEDTQGAIELPDMTELLGPGKHTLQLKMAGGSDMPYSMAIDYNTLKPVSAEACKVHLDVALSDRRIGEGAVTEARVAVVNRTGEPIPTPVAIIGVPGGLEVRHDQLKELVKAEKIAAYEVIGREVVLYWRSLDAEQRVELPISMVAAIPGTYTGPASRTYLYYTDEHKHWIDGLKIEIAPRLAEAGR